MRSYLFYLFCAQHIQDTPSLNCLTNRSVLHQSRTATMPSHLCKHSPALHPFRLHCAFLFPGFDATPRTIPHELSKRRRKGKNEKRSWRAWRSGVVPPSHVCCSGVVPLALCRAVSFARGCPRHAAAGAPLTLQATGPWAQGRQRTNGWATTWAAALPSWLAQRGARNSTGLEVRQLALGLAARPTAATRRTLKLQASLAPCAGAGAGGGDQE